MLGVQLTLLKCVKKEEASGMEFLVRCLVPEMTISMADSSDEAFSSCRGPEPIFFTHLLSSRAI